LKKVLLDYRTSEVEKENLYKNGYEPLVVPQSEALYYAVCGHPDMLLHILDEKNILVHKDMDLSFINILKSLGYNIFLSENSIKSKYPFDILLNGVQINNMFLHNLKYTDNQLLTLLKGKKFLDVKQGYSKCSTAIINNTACITSDIKICEILKSFGIDVLLIPPKYIELPGLDYGFIGGTCGLLGNGTIAFFGTLEKYKYGKEVLSFLIKHDVKPIFLSNSHLIDRGTLFCIWIKMQNIIIIFGGSNTWKDLTLNLNLYFC